MKSKSPEEWRKYFESGNCSIYQIISNAIRVAALDDPEQFKLRRSKIVERLYSCKFTGSCFCVDQTEQDVHRSIAQVFQDCKIACAHKYTKVDDSAVGGGRETDQQANELGKNIEDDSENIRRVLQIKNALENNVLTDTEIHESLRKLKLAVRSVGVMKATKIGSTISNLKRHKSKEISLLATAMADQWKSMIVEFVDKATEAAATSKNPVPSVVLEEWREFPSVEFVPQPPVEFSEKFLDDMDDYENAAGNKDNNEKGTEDRQKNAAKEKESEVKLQEESMKREKRKKETVEKFIDRISSNGASSKINVKVEKTEKNLSMGNNKRKLEEQLIEDTEFITPIRRPKAVPPKQESSIRQKPCRSAPNPNLPQTENPSDRDQKPPRVKKEVQNNYSEPRNRYRALLINAEPRDASPRGRESRRSSDDNTAMEERLETSKKKLRAGYQDHERAKRNIQLIPPEGDLNKKASASRSKNQARK